MRYEWFFDHLKLFLMRLMMGSVSYDIIVENLIKGASED